MCIKSGLIKPIEKMEDRSVEIINLVKHKLKFWRKVTNIAKDSPTILIEAHYELIKELLTALINRGGFKSETHDCLFYYMEEKYKDLELDFDFLQDLRITRNEIDYRGTKVPKDAWKEVKLKINLTIDYLIGYLK